MDRRQFLAASGLGVIAHQVGATNLLLSPRAAHALSVPYRVLAAAEVQAVEALGDTLLPGAADAGLAHYLDHHLAAAPADSLLMIRYLDVPPPYMQFYRPCLASVDSATLKLHGKPFAKLEPKAKDGFVAAMQAGTLVDWIGPPAPMCYFVLRADAVDVVYGTPEGFAKLGVPYMQHIMPATNW